MPTGGGLRPSHQSPEVDGSKHQRSDLSTDAGVGLSLPQDSIIGSKICSLWIHDETFSKEETLLGTDVFEEDVSRTGEIIEIVAFENNVGAQDFSTGSNAGVRPPTSNFSVKNRTGVGDRTDKSSRNDHGLNEPLSSAGASKFDESTKYRFIAKAMPEEIKAQHPSLQVSILKVIADTLGLRHRSQVVVRKASRRESTATHVEIYFRDQYLARSDMWRLAISELAEKIVYKGQKLLFLGSIKAAVKAIYNQGQKCASAYFAASTIPIFRSESARYVLFIQMSKEMWDFDAEGRGDVLFSRVIEGFLPGLFKRWADLEAKHLVSIVMFGRLEFLEAPIYASASAESPLVENPPLVIPQSASYEDFYRVVVSDMSSGQWRSILDELKKEYRVFLRDISLQSTFTNGTERDSDRFHPETPRPTICGQPSSALRGNILEAINVALCQYARDYVDRDLVRTGLSVVVITAGNGVFEVDRDLLQLTSENLTNNGIGIDLVCLSRMPLHSVPLFVYRKRQPSRQDHLGGESVARKPHHNAGQKESFRVPCTRTSSLTSTTFASSPGYLKQAHSVSPLEEWSFGIPQWIDVSFWAPELDQNSEILQLSDHAYPTSLIRTKRAKPFVPRVRMYELQMMGIMELGLANIAVPYLSEPLFSDPRSRAELNFQKHFKIDNVSQSGRSVNRSNTYSRKQESPAKARPPTKGLLTTRARQHKNTFDRMDEYDRNIFTANFNTERLKRPRKPRQAKNRADPNGHRQLPGPLMSRHIRDAAVKFSGNIAKPTIREPTVQDGTLPPPEKPRLAPGTSSSRISRSTSFALRGLGAGPPRADASTKVNVQHAQAESPSKSNPMHRTPGHSIENSARDQPSMQSSRLRHALDSESWESSDDLSQITPSPSRPISIRKPGQKSAELSKYDPSEDDHSFSSAVTKIRVGEDFDKSSSATKTDIVSQPDASLDSLYARKESLPQNNDNIAWIKYVNPSNPHRDGPDSAAPGGRWQHVFPKPPRTSAVKWRSLCTPAAVPLTTVDIPSQEELDRDYVRSPYSLTQNSESELREVPRTRENLLREMIALRLAHGYQVVLRSDKEAYHDPWPSNLASPYDKALADEGSMICLAMGNTIQCITCAGKTEVHVVRFVKKSLADNRQEQRGFQYAPKIRTILSGHYVDRPMTIAGTIPEYPWNSADRYLAGYIDDPESLAERLRFWRARFVLIPVEPPANARSYRSSTNEDNEEEIRLLGIQHITQIWQRSRYVPPEERQFAKSDRRKKDENPLDIIFRTTNPSEIVASEAYRISESANKPTQLLPESELFSRAPLNTVKLSQTMQGDKGVEILDRYWHWRWHRSCFIGRAMTTWLLENFKDIETREEAVELGSDLMDQGLFQHVDKRHNFRDGMYYYQFCPEFQLSRPESRSSWFSGRRSDKSMPATPAVEQTSKMSPLRSRSRSGSDIKKKEDEDEIATPTKENAKNLLSISMSKMIRINIDRHNRSERPEIVDLHYDRLHNPENCYHLELSWLNVTSKLVEDALILWATAAEKYGLRLVEVPIAEARSAGSYGPFRAPSTVKLKLMPPALSESTHLFYNATSLSARPVKDKFYYHKQILKRFNFVLDLEAASEFPLDVEVNYSWGRLDYKFSQFVHKSGVLLAQITDEGEFLLLANRLFHTRSSADKETKKFDPNYTHAANDRRPPQGTVTSNVSATGITPQAMYQSPQLTPHVRATSDVLGPNALAASGLKTYITPEQIKGELEAFCSNEQKLEDFYHVVKPKESISSVSTTLSNQTYGARDDNIPNLQLPESVVANPRRRGSQILDVLRGSPKAACHSNRGSVDREASAQNEVQAVDESESQTLYDEPIPRSSPTRSPFRSPLE
ncbi:MAG: hypothetical protein Q9227_005876 [Pyrenula ochraceoflavens]